MPKDPAKFWDRLAPRYAKMAIRNPEAYEEKLARTQAHFPPQAKALELGCGTGSTAIAHAPHLAEILATDISEEMLKIGRARAAEAGVDNIRFARLSVADTARLEEEFDVVLALNLLHLLPDPSEGLRAARARLRPGGLLIASTFFLKDAALKFRLLAPILGLLGVFPRLRPLSQAAFKTALSAAGFTLLESWQPGPNSPVFHIAQKSETR